MKHVIIYGGASKKKIKHIDVSPNDMDVSLMSFLLKNGIPVASSCNGDGVCQKCLVTIGEKRLLSCQLKMTDLLKNTASEILTFSYL